MNIAKRITNFFTTTNVVATQTQIAKFGEGCDNTQNQEVNYHLEYNCGEDDYQNSLEFLATDLTDNIYRRVFVDALQYYSLDGVSEELIKSGLFLDYYLSYLKSTGSYQIYIKKSKNIIIAISDSKIDDSFEEIKLDKVSANKYKLTKNACKVLANFIIATSKSADLTTFLAFKKEGFNDLFDITASNENAGEEIREIGSLKIKHMKEQLTAIQKALSNQGKSTILMMDAKDSMETIEVKYQDVTPNLEGIYEVISQVTGLPNSYLTGKFASSLSGNHSGDLEAVQRGIFNYFRGEITPFLQLLGIKTKQLEDLLNKKIKSMLLYMYDAPEEIKKQIWIESGAVNDIVQKYKEVK